MSLSTLHSAEQIKSQVQTALEDPNQTRSFFRMIRTLTDYRHRKTGLENDMEQLSLLPDLPVEKITCQALIVHGTHDSNVLFYHGVYAHENIPNSEACRVREASHLLCIRVTKHAGEFRERIVSCLQAHR